MKLRKRLWSFVIVLCLLLSLCPAVFAAGEGEEALACAEALEWAKTVGVMTEAEAAAFEPNGAMTRATAITMLWRASGSPAPVSERTPFTDLKEDWYRDAVTWAAEQGITNGRSSTVFAPDDDVTRSQMAAFLYRAREPGKTEEGPWWQAADRWAFDHILIFGHALPSGNSDTDDCLSGDALVYLYRCFTAPDPADNGEIVILYTSDVHCGIDRGFGYAGLYEVRTALEEQGYTTVLVDDGDAIQGEMIGTLSKGEDIVSMMNALGYDAAIPGNHEFSYGMSRFLDMAQNADYPYISCNFNREGELILAPYVMIEAAGVKLAFVGVTTPRTLSGSTPAYFQDEEGNFIYGFLQDSDGEGVYRAVQEAVDAAREEGADYVYVMGHMGIEDEAKPWTSVDVIGHTVGIDVFFDGHSHDSEQMVIQNREGKSVIRSACGTKLSSIGYSRIVPGEGIVETGIWSWRNGVSAPETLDLANPVRDMVDLVMGGLDETLKEVVAHSSVLLTIYDPRLTDAGGKPVRIVRRMETNLGDLCTDAFRVASGADAAVLNGGGIRMSIEPGDVTFGDIFSVFPFSNELCVIEVTGQMILDALEWGARGLPGENGGFLQVSGMRYEIDASVPSGCIVDENGMCAGIEGERRVRNVVIGGEPLDPAKTYTLAGIGYILLEHGDGYTAFDGAAVLQDRVKLDNQLLIEYITENLGGEIGEAYADPYGEGRITFVG
ncbi:MAG: 5'-nucleotidase C-terminal domain-containing protein [Oscillospiraceae bacterium]|nr:5'-nucleotidase C-terminal domain-containing protein [Oscillospiraceae bacterium]